MARPRVGHLAGWGAFCVRHLLKSSALAARVPTGSTFTRERSETERSGVVTVRGGDPDGLERLCRYLTRPPFSHERLERLDDDHIGLQLKTPYSDGTTHIALTHFELIERLCALVPRPNTHRVKYHGVFASASPHRSLVVPVPPEVEAAEADEREAETSARQEPNSDSLVGKRRRIRRLLWAELLKRTFGVDPKQCPDCGGRMKMIATIMRADVVAERKATEGRRSEAELDPGRSRSTDRGALHPAVPRPTQRRVVRGLVDVRTPGARQEATEGRRNEVKLESAGRRVNCVG